MQPLRRFYIWLYDLQFVLGGEIFVLAADGVLIPESHRGNIVLKRMISVSAAPAYRLDGDLEVVFEIDGVGDMPAIHGKSAV